GENLLHKVSGGIGRRGGKAGRRRCGLGQVVATGVAETTPWGIHPATPRAYRCELGATGVAEPRPRRIRMLTLCAVHGVPSLYRQRGAYDEVTPHEARKA